MHRRISNNRGASTAAVFFWIFVAGVFLYAASLFVPVYFTYYMMKTEVDTEAKNAHMYTDGTLTRRILDKADYWSIPVDKDSVSIERGVSAISIEVRYSVDINMAGYYTYPLEFDINIAKPLKETTGTLQ